ncbi:MAG: DUF359 domain-containing protein [Candidatus Heimdallarchaeota archaeon]|nr:DUF359 domain-containing protein [Candidatus Heimdallarchaeota archaeon]
MDPTDLILQFELRSELSNPQGELIKGNIEETTPILISRLKDRANKILAVGDVVTELLIDNGIEPFLIVTDGKTKRQELEQWKVYDNYQILESICPAAEINKTTWLTIRNIANQISSEKKFHLKIDGEEDLLVLPIILEFPVGYIIIYGQPNEGAVLRDISEESKAFSLSILSRMQPK